LITKIKQWFVGIIARIKDDGEYDRRPIFSFTSRWADAEFGLFLFLVFGYGLLIFAFTEADVIEKVSKFIPVAIFLVLFTFEGVLDIMGIFLRAYERRQERKVLESETEFAQLEAVNKKHERKLELWNEWNERRLKAMQKGESFDGSPPGEND
jgi:hypothetical protein